MQTVVYIGERLKRARLRRAMSQRALSKASGVTQSTIVSLENNRTEPHPSTLGKLSQALRIEPAELLGDE